MEDGGCRMEDGGCEMQDVRCRMWDGGCEMEDVRWTFATPQPSRKERELYQLFARLFAPTCYSETPPCQLLNPDLCQPSNLNLMSNT